MITITTLVKGQSPMIPENGLSQQIIDRMDILYGSHVFTSIRTIRHHEAFQLADSLYHNSSLSDIERSDLQYLIRDNNDWIPLSEDDDLIDNINYLDSSRTFYTVKNNLVNERRIETENRKPILKHFYKTPANFYEVNTDGFKMRINPVINFNVGKESGTDDFIFQNTRGLNIRASLDDKVYVFTNILENQARFNTFHEERISSFRAIPGNGLSKTYKSRVSDRINGWDFLNAQAYVGMKVSRSINIELGHGRHRIGNGIRSLLLSDWAHNYFYLKFTTKIWKFHYQNLFAELAPISDRYNPANTLLPKKYMANHYLSFKPVANMEIGLFETVIFSRENQFELQYLNPAILYRTVEQFLDSPDNVLIGLNGKWNLFRKVQLYGQFILDEFKLNEFTAGTGWWANKYGIQLGMKYLNLANVDHLDVQLEYNTVRPYTYTHREPLSINPGFANASYSHYNQPLAHPLGANFREFTGVLRYQIKQKWYFTSRFVRSSYGSDEKSKNWGGNILLPNPSREMDFGNELLQGVRNNVNMIALDLSYQFFHNYFLDFNLMVRKRTSEEIARDLETKYIGGGLRINLGKRIIDY